MDIHGSLQSTATKDTRKYSTHAKTERWVAIFVMSRNGFDERQQQPQQQAVKIARKTHLNLSNFYQIPPQKSEKNSILLFFLSLVSFILKYWPSWAATIKINLCLGRNILLARKLTLFCFLSTPSEKALSHSRGSSSSVCIWILFMDLFSCFSVFRNKKKVKTRIYMNRFCSAINLSSFIIACFKPQNIQLHVGKLSEGNLCAISIEGKDSHGLVMRR